MKRFFIGIIAVSALIMFSCNSGNDPKLIKEQKKEMSTDDDVAYIVIAEEVIQATDYTYMKVIAGERSYWIAVNKMDAKEGEEYYYREPLLMTNFESEDLQRTFDTIYFVNEISGKPLLNKTEMPTEDIRMERPKVEQKDIDIEPAKGGITIGELYANKGSYNGMSVRIKGEVVKYNPDIMGINWVHIQDGTSDGGFFDLTVTTHDEVSLGDVITFEGKIALDRDFGAGYKYEVIMENATQPDLQY